MKVRVELERPRPFYAVVFNAEQIEGLPPRTPPVPPEWNPIERAEAILQASGAKITELAGNRAFYSPATDSITLPERSFKTNKGQSMSTTCVFDKRRDRNPLQQRVLYCFHFF